MYQNKPLYDVAVIGAGPSGSTAARHLAQAGFKVVILDKEPWPRYKTCGGGLTARALHELPGGFNLPAQHLCHSSTIDISDSGHSFTARRDKPIIYMTMREELDAELVKQACDHGAEFYDNRQVTSVTNEETSMSINTRTGAIKSRLLIAADGVNSRIATLAEFSDHRRLAPAIEWEIPVEDQQMNNYADRALFDFGHTAGGYAWIFPKELHLSVGLGVMRGRGQQLPQQLTRFLEARGISAAKAALHKGQLIPVSPRQGPFAQNRVFLVGDAAGLVDPVTAEGLTYAMYSGRLAAEAIIEAAARPTESENLYNRKLQAELLREIRSARWLATLLYSLPKWRNWLFRQHGQRLTERMADIVMGKATYSSVTQQSSFWLRLFGLK